MKAHRLTCCVCGSYAGRWKQWSNRDIGYGICGRCVAWVQEPRGKVAGYTPAEMLDLYGEPGVHRCERLLYHCTFTENISSIERLGIVTGKQSNWTKRNDPTQPYDKKRAVFACSDYIDAVLWGGKMEWEFFQNRDIGGISIVAFGTAKGDRWEVDHNDPLSARKAPWLKSTVFVPEYRIEWVMPLTTKLLRDSIAKRNEEMAA